MVRGPVLECAVADDENLSQLMLMMLVGLWLVLERVAAHDARWPGSGWRFVACGS